MKTRGFSGTLKMQNWKIENQFAGVENAGPENERMENGRLGFLMTCP